jgi:glycosyltransferase involved in cell wall biosynthesis
VNDLDLKPKISVVMPAYKEEPAVLERAINSILNQTYNNVEFIIVLDEPSNKPAIELINEYIRKDSRIKLIVNEKNLGVAPTLNIGVKTAVGNYIARQDADDESYPYRFEKQLKVFVEDSSIDVVGSGIEYVDENGKVLLKRFYKEYPGDEIKRYNPIAHPSMMIKKEIYEKFGYYDEGEMVRYVEDYDLWLRWHLQGVKFYNINLILYKYFQDRGNIKSKNTKLQLRNTYKLKLRYRKHLKFKTVDYLRLIGEMLLIFLPSKLITLLFYKTTR